MRFITATVVVCVTLSSFAAEARPRSHASRLAPECNLMMTCETPHKAGAPLSGFGMFDATSDVAVLSPREARAARRAERRVARHVARDQRRQARADLRRASRRNADTGWRDAMAYAPPADRLSEVSKAPATGVEPIERESGARSATSMKGIVPGLASKVAQIQATCPGAHVISTVRHTRIRGTRRLSLHATGEAVDMRGNPSCIYAQLRDWPGGYSTDYGRARHIHISLSSSGREMGLRFVHGGGHKSRRFAMR